ncbi:hypothetical protein GYMLUDRAFT_207793 [Collybiopsis luxurians FD-317 M1]|uniref:Uncharacterized protein n=1 Tax=Collybiopsis luxurians FD-317 M1 TaxID=944289 RepID=A0A0D0BT51_9AGAR|nr:hypothetical protein GYMLUDRAFT_207793 [Collybiopsis luxurians FD-317 M1]
MTEPKLPSEQVNYSYIDNDYPETYPLDLPLVIMSVEESRHYSISGPDALEEWASSASRGFGYLRLGKEKRRFALSVFHQFHCLRLIRKALDGTYDAGTKGHVQHCLTYLRQMILCHPDLTLEPADIITRDKEVYRSGGNHICRDWSKVYEMMNDNFESSI